MAEPEPNSDMPDLDELLQQEEELTREGVYIGKDDPDPEPGPQPQNRETAEAMAQIVYVSFTLLAKVRGPHWAIEEDDARDAGIAYGAVVDKYFPDIEIGPELAALMITAGLFGPRIAVDRATAAAAEAESEPDLDTPEETQTETPDAGAE